MNTIKKVLTFLILVSTVLILVSCGDVDQDITQEVVDYTLIGEYTPNQVRLILEDSLKKIYSPSSEEELKLGVNNLVKLCTPDEAKSFKEDIGVFNDENKANVEKPVIKIALPENTSSGVAKILAKVTIEIHGLYQVQLLEFTCNEEGLIDNHSLWIKDANKN